MLLRSTLLLRYTVLACLLAFGATLVLPSSALAAMHPDVAKAYQQGITAARAGNPAQADYWLRQAMTLDPEDSLMPLQLGQALVDEGQTEKAIEVYRQAATLNSQDAMVYITLGNLYEQLQQWDLARQAYETGLRKNPDYRYGLLNLGRVLTQLNDKARALDVYNIFLVTYPNHVQAQQALARLYLASGQPQQAAEKLEALKSQQGNQFQDALLLSQALLQSKQPQQALMALEQAQRQGEAPADVAENQAKAYLQLGQNEPAIVAMQQALEVDPNRNTLRLQLGQLYMQTGQPAIASSVLETYVRQEETSNQASSTNAQWLLAKAYLDTERYSDAVPYLRRLSAAQTQPPLNPEALFTARGQLAFALQQSDQQQEAIAIYDTLLRQPVSQAPTNDLTLMKKNLALAYFQQGELEKALPLYRDLWQEAQRQQALNPQPAAPNVLTPESYPWLSGSKTPVQATATTPNLADDAFKHDYSEVLQALARQAYAKSQFAEADQFYSEALALMDTSKGEQLNSDVLLALANTRLAAGRKEEAEALYRQVLAAKPDQAEATLYLTQVLLLQNKVTPQQAADTLKALATVQESLPPLARQDYLRLQSDLALANQQWALVNESLQRLSTLTPLSAGELEQQATAYYQQGLFTEALKAYESALVLSPKNANLAYNAGLSAFSAKQWDAAETFYNQALSWQTGFADVHFARALVYEQRKQPLLAIADYERFLSLPQPESVDAGQVLEVKKRLAYLKLATLPKPAASKTTLEPQQATTFSKPLAKTEVKQTVNTAAKKNLSNKQSVASKTITPVKVSPLSEPSADLSLRGNQPDALNNASSATTKKNEALPLTSTGNVVKESQTLQQEEATAFEMPQLRPLGAVTGKTN